MAREQEGEVMGDGCLPADRDVDGTAEQDSRPVRVLYSFPHQLGLTGIGTTALNQVLGLVAAGADVCVSCTSLAVEVPLRVRVVETLRFGGRRIPHRALGIDRAWRYHDWQTAQLLRRLSPAFQVVHTWPLGALSTLRMARQAHAVSFREVPNTHTRNAYAEADREARLTGVPPALGSSHTFDPRRLARELDEYAVADRLLVPSENVASTFLREGFMPSKIIRHHYGYDPARFRPAPCDRRKDGPLTVAFVGRGEPRKGLHYALEAWLACGAGQRGGRFIVCGDLAPEYRPYLGRWLQHPSVEIRGFVPEVAGLLQEIDALVLPSVEEGSALVSYEAMACGAIPVVSSAVGACCRHGESGLVHEPRDVATLTAQLTALDADLRLRRRLRAGALKAARSLTWETAGRVLLCRYGDALKAA